MFACLTRKRSQDRQHHPVPVAKNISANFRQMVAWSITFGVASSILGLAASYWLDTSSGPTIVLTSILIFCITLAARK